jgi:hypothetical protein
MFDKAVIWTTINLYHFSHVEKAGVGTVDPSREAAVGGSCPVTRSRITALECDAYAAIMRLQAENL